MNACGEPVSAPSDETFTIAALAAVARRHALHSLARAQQRTCDVDAHHLHHIGERDRIDAPLLPADHAGVVYETSERPEHAVGLGEEVQDVGFRSDISLYSDRFPAGRLDVSHNRLGLRFGT